MAETSFFDESREQSRIKTRIVAKYFGAWAKVITSAVSATEKRIAYMDLFSGPGQYSDGTPSTPVIVLQKAIKDAALRENLVTLFNDKDPSNAKSLRDTINSIPGIETLKHKPTVQCEEVGQDIVRSFQKMKLIPTLLFVDPWGYKGLSLALIKSVLQNWGCDCVFFFNYNRVNPGLNNEVVREHMSDLFGEERAETIRQKLAGLPPQEREHLIIEELSQALKEKGATHVLPFTFKNELGTRTMHHLIFATKHFKGYEIMKEIMAKESSEAEQGVPSFEYSPVSAQFPLLFALSTPLDELEEMLLKDFEGQELTMNAVYLCHNVGRRYVKTNYKRALTNLESSSKIRTNPPANERPTRHGDVTFADSVVISFPRRTTK